ncbi:MAG: hypothetical protein HYV60_15885 [Planctomycetia bacterium]|nr:hypothetical protein [Planctomycetia bacterium]
MLKCFTLTPLNERSRVLLPVVLFAILVPLAGCRPEDQIGRYQVARADSPHRMLGAVVPQGDREWFFKVTGANDSVSKEVDKFTAFIESIQFGEGEEADPAWKLPEGWTQEPGK